MPTKKLRSVKGRRLRLTALDECGAPDYGNPCGVIVTSGFISVTWSDEVETGDEYTQKNAWGDFCIAEKDADRVKWVNVTLSLCEVDPEILVMLGGAIPNHATDGTMTGAFFTREPNPLSYAIEVWTKKAGTDACSSTGDPEWGYFAGYNVRNGMLDGDLTIESAPLALGMKGELYGASADWGIGPYTDNPLENVTGVPEGALRYVGITTVQPPDDTDGCQPITGTATGATAGIPGTWTPSGTVPPANLTALQGATPPITASPNTAWTTGQYVALGDNAHAHWSSTAWVTGDA
jgi:hypothetical protein